MTTSTLAKHYGQLTPRERVPLIEAAATREDETELARLVNSAPRTALRVPDYTGFATSLQEACFMYMMEQLNLATCYWRAEGLLARDFYFADAQPRRKKPGQPKDATEDRLFPLVRFVGYRIVTNANAWRRFCGNLNIDPEPLLSGLPGSEMLQETVTAAETAAFNTEEATEYARRKGDDAAEAKTVEGVLVSWREFLDHRTKWWNTE